MGPLNVDKHGITGLYGALNVDKHGLTGLYGATERR